MSSTAKPNILLSAIVLALLLTGCAWWEAELQRGSLSYHSFDGIAGYSDVQLDGNSFIVSYRLMSARDFDTIRRQMPIYLDYRCSELTINKGFEYFVVVNGHEVETDVGTSRTKQYAVAKSVTIKVFRGEVPSGKWGIHNAREVLQRVTQENQDITRTIPLDIQNRLAKTFRFSDYKSKDDDYGGYSEVKLNTDTFKVIYEGYSSEPLVFYRAAEVTLKNGQDYFEVISDKGEHDEPLNLPIYTSSVSGGLIRDSANYGGGVIFDSFIETKSRLTSRNVSMFIKMHKGQKPEYNYAAYNAREILDNLKPLISPPAN